MYCPVPVRRRYSSAASIAIAVKRGDADAMICGLDGRFNPSLRYIKDIIGLVPGATLAAARLREELVEFSQIFIQAYMEAARDSPIWIEDEGTRMRLLVLYLLAEALHEIENEAEKRADWINTSIDSVNAILDRMATA